jgi:hypothetical protein
VTAPAIIEDDPAPGYPPASVPRADDHGLIRSHHPHATSDRARRIAGLLAVGLLVGYEVGATALNEALEEDVLPTLQSLVQNTSLRSLEVRGARMAGNVGMWLGMIGVAVVVEVGVRRQRARRRSR